MTTDDASTPPPTAAPPSAVAYLGPKGTFTEEALLSQPDYAAATMVPQATIGDVLGAVSSGDVELGLVPIENALEGSVNATLDALIFDHDLLMQREVVIPVVMCLLAPAGVAIGDITRVVSMPVAIAQCRRFLAEELAGVEIEAANSTALAAQQVAEAADGHSAAIGPALAGAAHGLDVIATDIEDHPDNQTRFVSVARSGIPARTGHDKTTIVVFQRADRPGSLLSILAEFAARAINLTRLESRPTKQGLGDYCFIIDLEGHIGDEIVADVLRSLKARHRDVMFLGSYPAAGSNGDETRREADASWRDAAEWMDDLRSAIGES